MSNVVLGVENDQFETINLSFFLFSRPDYFMIYCEQVADFSELSTRGVGKMYRLLAQLQKLAENELPACFFAPATEVIVTANLDCKGNPFTKCRQILTNASLRFIKEFPL